MATAKQIAANQQNSRKSTGPKTARGKHNSSRNGLIHGFAAQVHTMDCEDPEAYRELLDHYHEYYEPSSQAQQEIIEQFTNAQWNLRRTRIIQKGAL